MTRLTDVDCPACEGQSAHVFGAVCATCGEKGKVSVVVATAYHLAQGRRDNEAGRNGMGS